MTIDLDHLDADYLVACAVSLGLPEHAITPRVLRTLTRHIDNAAGPDGCWPWTGPRNGAGYGIVNTAHTTRGPHRLAHVLIDGPLAHPRLVVRHTCDHPWCVNPAHLLRGTYSDNTADARERGRLRGHVLTDVDRDFIPRLADRLVAASARRGHRMTRPELFAFIADIFEVSAGQAGTVLDTHRRAALAADRDHEPAA